ncbi:MAG: outer membrane lipoprotein-sorting protein [Wenzhouxiangellaceae bacterium]|nr:outer membrane lipoprotein-sorting protein [Wenzhouxiangellaceae bacterium]
MEIFNSTTRRRICLLLMGGFANFIVAGLAMAQPPVEEIVHRANRAAYYQGKDGRAQVQMTITDSQGRKRERRMIILRRDSAETDALADHSYWSEQQYYVYFQRPSDLNRTVFMVHKHLDSDDDRWLYLPSLDLVRRIAATDKRNSFVGSDFFYEDVSGRNIDLDTHELVDTTDVYYVVKSTPKNPENVEFAWYESYIHKESFIPVRISFYKTDGTKYREASALKVETISGYPTVTRSRMASLETGSNTVMEYLSVEYDIGLPKDIFTERYLRKAPRKYLR